jgi:hypothetical protein
VAYKTFKTFTFGLLALSASVFVGCMGNDAPASEEKTGYVAVKVGTGDVNSAAKSGLGKGSTISLSKLIITMVSNSATPTASDTIRDTIRAGVHQNFVSTSTTNQTVDSVYVLKALRTWYITAKTLDTRDSVVHIQQDTIVKLLAGETRAKSITLNPRFVMYKANFSFPDSLATVGATSFKQQLVVKKIIMKVDGKQVAGDSTTTFLPNTPYSIDFDYVPVNTGTSVELSVVGRLTGWSFVGDSVLFRKTAISISGKGPGVDGSHLDTLFYVGPQTGKNNLTVTIVKVGLYQINVTTPAPVILKGSNKGNN